MSLVPISVDFLYEGLMVDYPIYYKEGDKLVLLCKDIVLTKKTLKTIRIALANGKNIYIEDNKRDSLLNDTTFFAVAQSKLEEKLGMGDVRLSAKSIINSAEGSGIVKRQEIEKIVSDLKRKLDENDAATLIQLVSGMRQVDEYLFTHSINVAILNGLIGRWMHMSDDQCEMLIRAGAVHDVGKVRISPNILNKPGKLTPIEFEAMKMHTQFGREMLEQSGETSKEILESVELHHERVNGTGYPYKLMGSQIPVHASITAISDIYDAMVARRSYKPEVSPFDILEQISNNAFSGLDMKIIKTFLQNMPAELVGADVLLSNGATAKVKFVNFNHYKYPMVEMDGELVQTNEKLYCVRIYTESAL